MNCLTADGAAAENETTYEVTFGNTEQGQYTRYVLINSTIVGYI